MKGTYMPEYGDEYYTVCWGVQESGIWVTRYVRADNSVYATDLYCGNCFRTKQDAENEKYNVFKRITGRAWKE